MSKLNDQEFQRILNRAHDAATEASGAYREAHGESPVNCGFAWVTVRPARGAFINWCRSRRKTLEVSEQATDRRNALLYGGNAYGGGWQFWGPGDYMGQDMDCKRAGAEAFARVLQEELVGITVEVGTRLD